MEIFSLGVPSPRRSPCLSEVPMSERGYPGANVFWTATGRQESTPLPERTAPQTPAHLRREESGSDTDFSLQSGRKPVP